MTRTPLLLAAATAVGLIGSRRLLREWGATKAEGRCTLPGDELVSKPAVNTTRAITIDASTDEVWHWLVQIGQDRGGMYSYDWIENLAGLQIHSTNWIDPQWQSLTVGQSIRLVRPGWLGLHDGYTLQVAQLEAGRHLVLWDSTWESVWSFHLHPLGSHRCRLISRSRAPRTRGILHGVTVALDPITFVMTRGMLLGIKRRAEGRQHSAPQSAGTSTIERDSHATDHVVRRDQPVRRGAGRRQGSQSR